MSTNVILRLGSVFTPPQLVKILGHVERVHLQNLLKGELLTMWLEFGVALLAAS